MAFIVLNQDKVVLIKQLAPFNSEFVYCEKDEPRHEKTGFLHMRKQRRRSASR